MSGKTFLKEDGFFSAVFLIVLVVIGGMALTSYMVMQKEVENSVNSAAAVQVDYSANGAAYMAIALVRRGLLADGETQVIPVGDVDVLVSAWTYLDEFGDTVWRLDINSSMDEGTARELEIDLRVPRSLANFAISAEGAIDDAIVADDSTGTDRTSRLTQEYARLPDLSIDELIDMAVLTLGSGVVTSFPTGSGVGGSGSGKGKGAGGGSGPSVTYGDSLDPDDPFYYWKDGERIPHVIYIDGDATFKNTTYSGIYIVNGSIDQQGGWTDINGVVLVLDPEGTYTLKGTHGGRYHVTGGIVSYGEIVGNGNPEVQHNYEYMEVFTRYAQEDLSRYPIVKWTYK